MKAYTISLSLLLFASAIFAQEKTTDIKPQRIFYAMDGSEWQSARHRDICEDLLIEELLDKLNYIRTKEMISTAVIENISIKAKSIKRFISEIREVNILLKNTIDSSGYKMEQPILVIESLQANNKEIIYNENIRIYYNLRLEHYNFILKYIEDIIKNNGRGLKEKNELKKLNDITKSLWQEHETFLEVKNKILSIRDEVVYTNLPINGLGEFYLCMTQSEMSDRFWYRTSDNAKISKRSDYLLTVINLELGGFNFNHCTFHFNNYDEEYNHENNSLYLISFTKYFDKENTNPYEFEDLLAILEEDYGIQPIKNKDIYIWKDRSGNTIILHKYFEKTEDKYAITINCIKQEK